MIFIFSLLAEYVGIEKMLAVVSKTFEGMNALETYDKEGHIDKSAGVHGLGASTQRPVNGRFLIICLEQLRHVSELPKKILRFFIS